MLSPAILETMQEFDPLTADIPSLSTTLDEVWRLLNALPKGSVARAGSRPMDYVYQWLFCVVCLLESRKKMGEKKVKQMSFLAP